MFVTQGASEQTHFHVRSVYSVHDSNAKKENANQELGPASPKSRSQANRPKSNHNSLNPKRRKS
jgi:hypothetical protein